jgi:hypothetical protein
MRAIRPTHLIILDWFQRISQSPRHCAEFWNMQFFAVRSCSLPAQPPTWRTIPLSAVRDWPPPPPAAQGRSTNYCTSMRPCCLQSAPVAYWFCRPPVSVTHVAAERRGLFLWHRMLHLPRTGMCPVRISAGSPPILAEGFLSHSIWMLLSAFHSFRCFIHIFLPHSTQSTISGVETESLNNLRLNQDCRNSISQEYNISTKRKERHGESIVARKRPEANSRVLCLVVWYR